MRSRLDKLLADNGFGTRREIKRMLRTGRFIVNGAACADPGLIVDTERDSFIHDGNPFVPRAGAYLMLNKPAGVITSTADPDHATVMDLLGEPWSLLDLFPVGRLDADTEGLLLITDDGALSHALTSPKNGVDKTYLVRLRDPLDQAAFESCRASFSAGVTLRDGYTTLPARLGLPPGTDRFPSAVVTLTIQEGKYHQVKRMFAAVGNAVAALTRISMGPLLLDPSLDRGACRELTEGEILALRAAVSPGSRIGADADADADAETKGLTGQSAQ